MTFAARALPLLLLFTSILALPAPAQVAPDARWSTFDTEHFRVHFHEGLEPFARRAAERAERSYALLATELTAPPEGKVDLVLSNNVDFANGYATPVPRNRVVVYAHPPSDSPTLAFYDDWLDLVILHELVHIYHLDQAAGIWERLRSVFGRSPILFPQAFTTPTVTEGLATYYESALTGTGRVRGTFHDMVLRTAILEDRFFPIDRAFGEPVVWPGASTRYIYGSMFLDHLGRTRGREAVREFVRRYGRQLVPYRLDHVARRSFGTTFTRAWSEWEDSLRARYGALEDSLRTRGITVPERLTRHGRASAFPRWHPGGDGLVYAASTGRDEPALRWVGADGTVREVESVTSLSPVSWFAGGAELLHAQVEYVDPYHPLSDLHRVRLTGGDIQITERARIWDPSVHPDGRTVAAVGDARGTNVLVLHDLASGKTRPIVSPDPAVQWSNPRWSPDGSAIAVTRWTAGGNADVVLVDSTGRLVRELTRERGVDDAPAWSPDGRYVVFASDRSGISNLYAYDLQAGRLLQVSNVLTGAFQPDVSPDGRWIAFSLYGAEGYDVARVPFDPASWGPPAPPRATPPPARSGTAEATVTIGGVARPYSALETLPPTSWELLLDEGSALGLGLGVGTFGLDVVERHFYAGSLVAYPEGTRVEGGAGYQYRGLGNPLLDLYAVQDWSVDFAEGVLEAPGGSKIPTALLRREREVGAALRWRRQRWRSVGWVGFGGEILDAHREWHDPDQVTGVTLREIPLDLGGSVDAGYSNARAFAFSVGPQQGFSVGATAEAHRYAEPFAGDADPAGYTRLRARGRAFHPLFRAGWARHVIAVRVDGGLESGSRSPGLRVGGASGGSSGIPGATELLGGSIAFPIRGYPAGVQEGDRAFSASAEYRFPLALVERGYRTIPAFLGRVYGDAFLDAGAAWCTSDPDACRARFLATPTAPDPLLSAGAELVAHLQLGFLIDLPLRLGVAFPMSAQEGGRPEVYLRVGRAF